MYERDIFNETASFGFKKVARQALCFDNDPNAPQRAIKALAKRLKTVGCPGFSNIVDTVFESVMGTSTDHEKLQSFAALDSISEEALSDETERVVTLARKLVTSPQRVVAADGVFAEVSQLRKRIGAELLLDLVDSLICPAASISKVSIELRTSFNVIDRRRTELRSAVSRAPEFMEIVEALVVNGKGQISSVPRMARIQISQQEILNEALGN